MTWQTIFIVILLALIYSCTESVDTDFQGQNSQPVINCLFSTDKNIQIHTFKTTGISANYFETAIDLPVKLYGNGQLIWKGKTDESGIASAPVTPEAGKSYSVQIEDSQGRILSASDTMPEKVRILKAEYIYPVYTDEYYTQFGKLSLSFQDNPNNRNYYEIVLLNSRDSSIVLTFNVNHPVITLDNESDPNPPGSLLFTDELFEGQQLDLDIFTESEKPLVVLKNISEKYYEYKSSLNTHLFTQNIKRENIYELFKADPVELYSNVSNGLGIFAAYTEDVAAPKMLKP